MLYFLFGIVVGIFIDVAAVWRMRKNKQQFSHTRGEKMLSFFGKKLSHAFPVNKRGSIYIPPDDAELARQEVLLHNQQQGIDTPLANLYE